MNRAEIITIGDEILIGQIIDTNSAWMAEKLNSIGIHVVQISSVPDKSDHIISALDSAKSRADFILITGGLGPTKDDITKTTLSAYFGSNLVESQVALKQIESMLGKRGIPVIKLNRDQALLPDTCQIIPNKYGTAMGMWFEKDQKVFISMPGVPYEMKGMMEDVILSKLAEFSTGFHIIHETILVVGYPESLLSQKISNWEENLPMDFRLAYLPSPGKVRLRISAEGNDKDLLRSEIRNEINKLEKIIPGAIANLNAEPVQKTIGNLLRDMNKSIATAESCTGGKIAHYITSIPGSSDYFKGSIVAYSNETKENILGVSHNKLLKFGAVSQAVVEEMASGARKLLNVDFAVATSGIAGPGGRTNEKPVGTTWIAIASPNQLISKLYHMGDHRERNIEKTTISALDMLRRVILSENKDIKNG